MNFHVQSLRARFPILTQKVYGKPLVYLDNAATTQKPQEVIDCLTEYYSLYNANIHRGVHYLSQKASAAYDGVRGKVQQFINASSEREIIFVRGTTEAINLVVSTYGRKNIGKDDEIIISAMEHHSNIVSWQLLCEEKGARLRVIPMNEKGELQVEAFDTLVSDKTKFVSIVYVSNSLGSVNPVKEIIRKAHARNLPVLVDGAQAVSHMKVDVQELDCDFFVFSGHKMFGPTGVGVLYGKLDLLEGMPPYQGGGDMISSVSFSRTTFNEVPFKFEAGTPHIEGVIGLGAAIDFMSGLDMKELGQHEHRLVEYASQELSKIEGMRLIGTAKDKAGVVSFVIDGMHPLDIGTLLDTLGVAVRTGAHCTEPVMDFFGIPGTVRASFALYNTHEEVKALVEGVKKAATILRA